MEQSGTKPINHYEYHKACAISWIDPEDYTDEGKSNYKTPSDNEQDMSILTSGSLTQQKARFSDVSLDL